MTSRSADRRPSSHQNPIGRVLHPAVMNNIHSGSRYKRDIIQVTSSDKSHCLNNLLSSNHTSLFNLKTWKHGKIDNIISPNLVWYSLLAKITVN